MAQETNETTPRGTTADPIKTRKGWGRRLLKATFWGVWVIEKGFRLGVRGGRRMIGATRPSRPEANRAS